MKFFDVILASASPRRAALISRIPFLRVRVSPARIVEPPYTRGEPTDYVADLAARKANDVLLRTGGVVIGADTIVTIDGRVLGKPRDYAEADEMFRLLCGRTHAVYTGVCVTDGTRVAEICEGAFVTFDDYDEKIVRPYIASGAPFDKAGGYGIQDAALAPLVTRVEGDTDTVVGLPVCTLEKTLKEFLAWQP